MRIAVPDLISNSYFGNERFDFAGRGRYLLPNERWSCRPVRRGIRDAGFSRGQLPAREQPAVIHREPAAHNPGQHEDRRYEADDMMQGMPAAVRR